MQGIRTQLANLREMEERRHREILAAIDSIEAVVRNLDGAIADLHAVTQQARDSLVKLRSEVDRDDGPDMRTLVDRVSDAIGLTPKTVDAIAAETGIPEEKVRGVLYNAPTRNRVKKIKINKRLHFISKDAAEKARHKVKAAATAIREGTNRKRVVDFLSHSPGSTAEQIEAATGLTRVQIKTVLYAQDSRRLFRCDEKDGKGHFFLTSDTRSIEELCKALL